MPLLAVFDVHDDAAKSGPMVSRILELLVANNLKDKARDVSDFCSLAFCGNLNIVCRRGKWQLGQVIFPMVLEIRSAGRRIHVV